MNVIHKYKISFVFGICSALCLIAYNIIGTYVDDNGFLIEPFGLIFFFWLFQLLALIALIITFVKHRKGKK
ncbi:DUF3955 domain-containing protein [Shewanella intestini]|uniref:DUF3955 domain-containing protein n=1 Tax=Shewanella intestini TaxID=2017544 RepID=A0ABS5I834_9GAMM|nr:MULTISPECIES: DUF3955 domain-containing protein [Shewanella]MBR9729475.1 DUF3955 domain-containing protein [Shewanella intestini]MRG35064.1 DUF3955 domain-containing protein [Shewanella sp. XMDDZSB0408]